MTDLPRTNEHGWPIIHFSEPIFCRHGHELPNPSPIVARWSTALIYVPCHRCRPMKCIPVEMEELPETVWLRAEDVEGDGG